MRRRKTSTTTTTTTSTPIVSTVISSAPAPVVKLRGSTLGISAGSLLSLRILDECLALGFGWVRCSYEAGWTETGSISALATMTKEAHARGLKVLHVAQSASHRYDDPLSNSRLASHTVDAVRIANVDAVEVGNEWNHKGPFWTAPDVSIVPPVAQAVVSCQIAGTLRTYYPELPIITPGMSPEADPLNPWTWWPQFLDAAPVAHAGAGWTALGLHPYTYPELATTNPARWNPLRQVTTLLEQSRLRGFPTRIWLTELGAPGFATNAPIIRGVALTEEQQAANYRSYIDEIHLLEAGGVRFDATFFATAFDGDSVTTTVEKGLGLSRSDGTHKPARQVVADFAREPLV